MRFKYHMFMSRTTLWLDRCCMWMVECLMAIGTSFRKSAVRHNARLRAINDAAIEKRLKERGE